VVPKLSHTPGRIGEPAPRLGEHTQAVLAELGCSPELINNLQAAGVIGVFKGVA